MKIYIVLICNIDNLFYVISRLNENYEQSSVYAKPLDIFLRENECIVMDEV